LPHTCVCPCGRFRCQCVGVEIDEERLTRARERIDALAVEDPEVQTLVTLRNVSIFEEIEGLMNAKLIVMYLFREAMQSMAGRMKGMLSDVVVVAIGFKLPGYIAAQEIVEGAVRAYVYKIEKCKT